MEFELLSGLAARHGAEAIDLGGPKQRAVLAALLLEAGRPIAADRLVQLVWGDEPPARAESSLQAYISNLRRVLEPGRRPREEATVLVTRPGGYAVEVPRGSVDVSRFEDLAADGRGRLGTGGAAEAVTVLDRALALWTGPLLPELAHEPWVTDAAARLTRIHAQALEDRVEAGLVLGQHAAMVPLTEKAILAEPYRERLRGQLAVALYRSGRQREALAALDEARRALGEVGLEPGRDLRRLEQEILRQDPSLDPPATDRPTGVPTAVAAPGARHERPFVGRERELAALVDAFHGAEPGAGRPVVVSGEPGIGKTRLVEELAAAAGGAVVAWARCPESAAQAAYWPCVQIGRQLVAASVAEADLTAMLPDDDAPGGGEPVPDRLALHAWVTDVLVSADTPLVLVIDDLQWADPASLRLLEYVAGELRRTRVLLLVTVRPTGPDAPEPLLDCLAELARQPGAVRLELGGLTEADVRQWLGLRSEGADPDVAGLLHARTGGNAFFVGELVELLASEGRLEDAGSVARGTAVPAAVQDVVRRRIARLPVESQQLLTTASVVGRTFDLDIVADVSSLESDELLDRLEPALDSGLVEEHPRPGRFQFAHALVADTLTAELSAVRRARLHAATGRSLARLRAGELDEDVAALAHHFFEGATAGTAEDAYLWSVKAARLATTRTAHEDASEHWLRAARAVEVAQPRDVRARHEALFEAGMAQLRVDALETAYGPLVEATELGLSVGDPSLVGPPAAAMNIDGLWLAGEIALSGVDALGCLQRAVAMLPPEPTAERSLVLGALAENGYWLLPAEELDAISNESVEVARALDDDGTVLARSLHKRIQTLWRAATLSTREEAADELLDLVETRALGPDLEALALFGSASVDWEEADVATALERVVRARRLVGRTGSPPLVTQLAFFHVSLLCATGELDAADELIDDTYDLYRRTRRWAAEPFRAGFKTMVWMEQDRAADVLAISPAVLDSHYAPVFGECIAMAFHRLGEHEAAAALTTTTPVLVDSWMFLGAAAAAAHNRVDLGDRDAARPLYDQLAPYAGRLATVGTGPSIGDIDLALGRVARLLGDEAGALRHLDASVATLTEARSPAWLTRALLERHDLAGDPADLERARAAVAGKELRLVRRQLEERQDRSK